MGQQQSKDELLYQQVNYANIEGIKQLRNEGAGLEWIDREGKTPLIVACMNPELFTVAKTLIELGANVNAYRPGCHAGTPLHHAAKRGLDQTVKLLLSHGANALVMNDDCQTPLDVARAKGYSNVVRAIENHICLFSGWLRELYGPGFLEALASQWLSRKIWVVVIPCGSRDYMKPAKLELAIYPSAQDAQPRVVIALWKAKLEEPKFHQSDPVVVIFDKPTKTRYKLASANEADRQQLQWFLSACRGIPQVMHHPQPHNVVTPVLPATAPSSTAEDVELAMAINASIQSAMAERPPLLPDTHLSSGGSSTNGWGNFTDNPSHNGWGSTGLPAPAPPSKASSSGWLDKPPEDSHNGWGVSEAGPTSSSNPAQSNLPSVVPVTQEIPGTASIPSAPPIPEGIEDGPIHYPSIDISPVDLSMPTTTTENKPARSGAVKEDDNGSSSCVICLDAPVEGACIPCGHMAGCMSCLNNIKAKKWGCPVCRAKIDQVIRLYAV
ncbi:zinc finger protein [Macleaya cordata]|uniref:Zinc finger protein n=1 Tax=Macleaya cordata TaxID=56857 RepID=A0A200PW06_MACCD|nr:zinc finger protein [Macleaya cordata]